MWDKNASPIARYTLNDKAAIHMVADIIEAISADPATSGLAAAIVGAGGELVAFGAHHSCPPLPRLLAQRKAYTALMLRRSTRIVQEDVRSGSLDMSVLNDPRLLPMPGGEPVFINGTVVGAIGISGLTAEKDIELAHYWAAQFS
ncbi:heme-binding protein [Sodalis ligni]|uniref:GlcG/HbpS family heme-binding protein n=1 Tax=Sodalis ligni TaxID=2697027 RepID=UPI00193F5638|nr:heme-binding protein [Sodalis ligni]QWA13084.1 heme-binding protein [Sodalis ligni]